jgi:hypothetical protein
MITLNCMFQPPITRFIKRFFQKSQGQISKQSEIGRWIELLSSCRENEVIVEVGTWNGRGSSRQILNGLKLKNSKTDLVIGFETNEKMFKKAKRSLSRFENYNLIFGSLVKESELDLIKLTPEEEVWATQDSKDLQNAPYVFDLLPDWIDLLILDGGEFSTYSEFNKLQSRVRGYIILDDTRIRKCSRILSELDMSIWSIIFMSDERNGVAVLKRVKSASSLGLGQY